MVKLTPPGTCDLVVDACRCNFGNWTAAVAPVPVPAIVRRWIVVRDSTQVQARPGVVLGDRAGVNPVADAGAVDAAADTGAGDAALVNAGVATADAVLARTTTRLSIVSVLRVLAGLSLLMRNPSRLSEHRGA